MSPFYDIWSKRWQSFLGVKKCLKRHRRVQRLKDPLELTKLPRALRFYFERSIWLPRILKWALWISCRTFLPSAKRGNKACGWRCTQGSLRSSRGRLASRGEPVSVFSPGSVWYPQLEHLLFLCEFRQKAECTEQRGSLPSLLPQRRHVKLSDEPLLFSARKRYVPCFQIKHIVGTPERLNTPTSLPQSVIGALSPFLWREHLVCRNSPCPNKTEIWGSSPVFKVRL